MEWSTFVPTLLATFVGVLLSVILSFGAYRLWDYISARRQRATTKHVLSLEIASNLARLKNFQTFANKVLNAEGSIRTLFPFPLPVHTAAYNAASQSGEIHRLGDSKLEGDLILYANECENFNVAMSKAGEIMTEKFGVSGDVPPGFVKKSVQGILPQVDKLVNWCHELLNMMSKDWGESGTPSERGSD